MALDEPSENDEIHREEDFEIIIEKSLLSDIGGVSIDFSKNRWMGSQFLINPVNDAVGCSC
ncbi:MAG: hypothetical protein GY847_35770 [Proteobacteria bacterium]|nr:hypothetical protein [Pseudomonadota bacterium]